MRLQGWEASGDLSTLSCRVCERETFQEVLVWVGKGGGMQEADVTSRDCRQAHEKPLRSLQIVVHALLFIPLMVSLLIVSPGEI